MTAYRLTARVGRAQFDHEPRRCLAFSQSDGVDLVLMTQLTFGIGYAPTPTRRVPYLPVGHVAFWGGWSGSLAVMDLDRRVTITYLMARMAAGVIGSPRSEAYQNAVYAALD